MTPVEIQLLLHCFCIREKYPHPSPATDSALKRFLMEDLIIEDMDDMKSREVIYRTTPRGDAMVEMLMTTPLPNRAWVDPRTKEVIG